MNGNDNKTRFWTPAVSIGALATGAQSLPGIYGYKTARLKGKSKKGAVLTGVGYTAALVAPEATAIRFLGPAGIPVAAAMSAGAAMWAQKKWKKNVAQHLREKKLHPYHK